MTVLLFLSLGCFQDSAQVFLWCKILKRKTLRSILRFGSKDTQVNTQVLILLIPASPELPEPQNSRKIKVKYKNNKSTPESPESRKQEGELRAGTKLFRWPTTKSLNDSDITCAHSGLWVSPHPHCHCHCHCHCRSIRKPNSEF